MLIRRAKTDDLNAILKCRKQALEAINRDFYTETQILAWVSDAPESKYAAGVANGEIYIAERPDDILGFGWIKAEPFEVRAVYVFPGNQGQGIGSKILHFLEKRLRALDAGKIGVGASLNAQAFNERHGYVGGEKSHLEIGGVLSPYVPMTKTLR